MTGNTDKLRALILSALMVLSVFGGTIAFAGSAAATASNVSASTQSNLTPASGTGSAIEIRVTGNIANDLTANITVDLSNLSAAGVDLSDVTAADITTNDVESGDAVTGVTYDSSAQTLNVSYNEGDNADSDSGSFAVDVMVSDLGASGVAETTVTVGATVTDLSNSTQDSDTTSVVVDGQAPSMLEATAVPNLDSQQSSAIVTGIGAGTGSIAQDDTLVEVVWDQAIDTSELELQDFQVQVGSSWVQPKGIADPDGNDGHIFLVIDSTDVMNVGAVNVTTAADFDDLNGNGVVPADIANVTATTASTSIDAVDGDSPTYKAYTGELVAVVAGAEDADLEINTAAGQFIFSGSTGTDSRIYLFNTANRNTSATYEFTISSVTDSLELRNLG